METAQILNDLRAERDRLEQAIAALEENRRVLARRPSTTPKTFKLKRRMSAAGKKKIAAANKKRWAAWRKKNA